MTNSSVPIKPPTFITTPSLKAVRTKAWKASFVGFSEQEAREMFPANSFVVLKVPGYKLRQSGIPTIKTRWESYLIVETGQATAQISSKSNPEFRDHGGLKLYDVSKTNDSSCKRVRKEGKAEDGYHEYQGTTNPLSPGVAPANHGDLKHVANKKVRALCDSHREAPATPISYSDTNSALVYLPSSVPGSDPFANTHAKNVLPNTDATTHKSEVCDSKASQNVTGHELRPIPLKRHLIPPREARYLDAGLQGNQPAASCAGTNFVASSLSWEILSPRGLQGVDTKTHQFPSFCPSQNSSSTRPTATLLALLQGPPDPNRHSLVSSMAPVRDPNSVDASLKDAIQKLYEVQSQVHGFVPETQPLLIDKMAELARSLAHIQTLTSTTQSPNNPIHKNRIAPEVIDYVDDSRNPDIYNREFVELVQRGNAVMNGKQQAFRDFSVTFANVLKEGMPELSDQVDKIMKNANMPTGKTDLRRVGGNGANGASQPETKLENQQQSEPSANGV